MGNAEMESAVEFQENGGRQGDTFMIVGGSSLTGQLLPQLPGSVEIIVVEKDGAREEPLRQKAGDRRFTFHEGDATSAIVLEKAGIRRAQRLLVLLRDDEATCEVCSLAVRRFKLGEVIALVQSEETQARLTTMGVKTLLAERGLAHSLKAMIFPGKQIAHGIGLEQGEIIEVLVLPSSPIIGVPLSQLGPKNWLLAAIYRDGDFVLPRGSVTVQSGDRVLLVGNPSILPIIADFIHRGNPGFPLSFGSEVLIVDHGAAGEKHFGEGCYMLNITKSVRGVVWRSQTMAAQPQRAVPDYICKSLQWVSSDETVQELLAKSAVTGQYGLVVIPWRTTPGFLRHTMLNINSWEGNIASMAHCPVLVSRGTFPYRKILVCLSPATDPLWLGTSAIELSLLLEAELDAVTVRLPDLVLGKDEHGSQTEVLQEFRHLLSTYHVQSRITPRVGNPVRIISKLSKQYDLVVISHSLQKKFRFLKPDVSHLLMLSCACSTLIIPDEERHREIWKRRHDATAQSKEGQS